MADNFDNYSMKVQARVDMPSNKDIDAQIRKLEKSISKLKVSGQFDDTALKNLTNQLNNLKSTISTANFSPTALTELTNQVNRALQNIQISNIKVGNQAQQVGQQIGNNIGQQITQSISSAIQKGTMKVKIADDIKDLSKYIPNGKLLQNDVAKQALKDFQALGVGIVTVKEEMKNIDGKNLLNGFTINIKNAKGEVESLRYALTDIEGKTGKMFQYVGGSINDNGVIKQLNTISAKADSLQTKLEKLKSSYSDMNASRPIKDSNNISALSQQYDKVAKSIENVRNADSSSFSSMVSNAQREIAVLENMVSQFRNAENVATQMKSVDISSGIAQAQERLGKLKANASGFDQMKQTIVDLDTAIANVGDKSSLDAFINKLKVAESQLGRVKSETKQLQDVNEIQLSYANGDYEAKVESTIAKTKQWVNANGEARISTTSLSTALSNLDKAYLAITANGGNTVANQKALKQAESELSAEIKKVTNEVTNMNATMAKSSAVDALRQKYQDFYDKNTASHQKWGKSLLSAINELAPGAEVSKQRVQELNQQLINTSNAARQAGKLGLSFFDGIKEQAKKFTQWVSVTSVVMEGVQAVKQLISVSKELDAVMTDFTMATGTTGSKLEALTESYSKLADKLKSTTTDVMTSATEWIKQGQSIADTETLVSNSMILSKIGKLDSADATKYLTSAMKGYKVSVDDTLSVVDKLSAVDMASATDVGGLAEGMSEVAASADLAGVSMDKLLGYLAAIGETTQSGMSEVGTTLNAVFSRMGNIKLSRLKDYDNNGEDLSNVETVLRGVGISLRDSANSFRDFDKVLDETANNWSNYSDVQQRAIASAFAGTHHMNEFIVLMENYDKALEYTEKSLNSSGEAMDKFSAYEKSVEAHTESFTNAIQSLSDTAVDSGLVNFFIDLGTTGVKAIDGLVSALTPLGTIGVISGGILGAKNAG